LTRIFHDSAVSKYEGASSADLRHVCFVRSSAILGVPILVGAVDVRVEVAHTRWATERL
jgi:hypothetical protein